MKHLITETTRTILELNWDWHMPQGWNMNLSLLNDSKAFNCKSVVLNGIQKFLVEKSAEF